MPYRELVVMTRPLNYSERTPGHAMIAVATAGVGEEAWGFYQSGVEDEILMGGWHHYNRSSVIPILDSQYNSLKREIGRWRGRTYRVTYRDCTDFVISVMSAARIPTPDDSLWPGNLGQDVEALNGAGGGRCIDARPPTINWNFSR